MSSGDWEDHTTDEDASSSNPGGGVSEQDSDKDDHYAVLNVPREASDDDVRTAYRRLCVIFHPDKHESPADRHNAKTKFQRIKTAYDVLSNRETRALYDTFGHDAFKMDLQVVPSNSKYLKDLKHEYQRLVHKEKELARIIEQQPEGSFKLGLNLTSLFGDGEEDSEDDDEMSDEDDDEMIEVPTSSLVTEVRLSQSKMVSLTDTISLSGQCSVGSRAGSIGVASFIFSLSKVLSDRLVLRCTFGVNNLSFHPFDNRPQPAPECVHCHFIEDYDNSQSEADVAGLSIFLSSRKLNLRTRPNLSFSVQHRISDSLTQTVALNEMLPPTGDGVYLFPQLVSYSLHHSSGTSLHLDISRLVKVVTCEFKLARETFQIFTSISYSNIEGFSLSYGTLVLSQQKDKAGLCTISVSSALGVSLLLKYVQGKHKFTVPIQLSHGVSMPAVFYGTVAPVVLYRLLFQPLRRWSSKLRGSYWAGGDGGGAAYSEAAERERRLEERRKAADRELKLMKETIGKSIERERKRNGLLIQRAWYGKFGPHEQYPAISSTCISVANQLQACVVQSKLVLHQGQSKSSLPGFFDPCPEAHENERRLKIVYLFQQELHEATFGDLDPVRLPKMSHRMQ